MTESTADAIGRIMNSPCRHGFSARKRCSKCQSEASSAGKPKAPAPGPSVYDDPAYAARIEREAGR